MIRAIILIIYLSISFQALHANNLENPSTPYSLKEKKNNTHKLLGGLNQLLINWEYHQKTHKNKVFVPKESNLNIINGFIRVDAVAANDVKRLEAELKSLGMKDTSSYERFISGDFLVSELRKASALHELHSMRPIHMATHNKNMKKGNMASQQVYRNQIQ